MQSSLNEEKQKVKNKVKKFFEENGIEFNEDERHLRIKGELFYVDILQYIEISIRTKTDEYLTITYDIEKNKEKLILKYEKTFPKESVKELEIQKSQVTAVYYTNNKLVFLF